MTAQYQGLAVLGLLFVLVYIGFWVATVFMARTGRTASWWTMVAGLILTGMGVLSYAYATYRMTEEFRSGRYLSGDWTYFMLGGAVGFYGGLIFFTLGLIMSSLRMGRFARRAAELEQLCATMAAEINSRGQNAPPRF